jgi:hypothetical protein
MQDSGAKVVFEKDEQRRSSRQDSTDRPLDLDEFLTWLSVVLGLKEPPDPSARLGSDLGIDYFRMIELVNDLDVLLGTEGWARGTVYRDIVDVRALHLHYLEALSLPWESN